MVVFPEFACPVIVRFNSTQSMLLRRTITGHANSGVTTMVSSLSQYVRKSPLHVSHCQSIANFGRPVAASYSGVAACQASMKEQGDASEPQYSNPLANIYETLWASDHSTDMILTTGLLWIWYRCWLQCRAAHHGTQHSLQDPLESVKDCAVCTWQRPAVVRLNVSMRPSLLVKGQQALHKHCQAMRYSWKHICIRLELHALLEHLLANVTLSVWLLNE